MQVNETLSDGLKRAWSVVVPAADIDGRRSKRLAVTSRAAACADCAGLPNRLPV